MDVDDGEKLRRLLETTRRSQAELAAAAQVTRAAVYRWVNTKQFPPRMWQSIASGLTKIGINPAEIRGSEGLHAIDGGVDSSDLTTLVRGWSREQLVAVKRILEADPSSRGRLLAYILGALDHFHA